VKILGRPEVAWHGRACTGETLSGDVATVVERPDGVFLAIVDALGHGAVANEVARRAAALLRAHAGPDLEAAMRRLHEGLREGVGAAAGVCWIDARTGQASWVAVGNVALRTFGSVETRLTGRDGLVGKVLPTFKPQSLRVPPGDLLVLATDGLRDHFSSEDYPGLHGDSAAFAARSLVERFGRDHDDVTVVAVRMPA
jgi:serine phosphatase RsbU (regulator of sigma subunit)